MIEYPKINTRSLYHTKWKRHTWLEEILTEFMKLVREQNMGRITELFNLIYNNGTIPADWLKSKLTKIPTNSNDKTYIDYRLISLMSHLLKVLQRILHSTIHRKYELDFGSSQLGFRNSFESRKALFALKVRLPIYRVQPKDGFVCFVNSEKAFDKVKQDKLLDTLQQRQLADMDISIIESLYWEQTAEICVADVETYKINIHVESVMVAFCSLLFNLNSDIFKEALEGVELGLKQNGTTRYTDDTPIMCDSLDGLQQQMDRIREGGMELDLNINANKNKCIIIRREQ